MTTNEPGETPDELPPTPLARLAAEAKDKMAAKPERHGPAAVKAMAAVVRDLRGMPDIAVTREGPAKLRIGRRGKVGFIVLAYDEAITAMDVTVGGFSEPRAPGARASDRYALQGEAWVHMSGGGDLFTDLRDHILKLYPELA